MYKQTIVHPDNWILFTECNKEMSYQGGSLVEISHTNAGSVGLIAGWGEEKIPHASCQKTKV